MIFLWVAFLGMKKPGSLNISLIGQISLKKVFESNYNVRNLTYGNLTNFLITLVQLGRFFRNGIKIRWQL